MTLQLMIFENISQKKF